MKERPILFSGPLVRALLDGRKTQTRRIVSGKFALEWLQPGMFTPEYVGDPANGLCPYGAPGDRLWVRETWKPDVIDPDGDCVSCTAYHADGAQITIANTQEACDQWLAVRRPVEQWPTMQPAKWRPSIHMPRWASRLTLEVTEVRVERVQDISETDAQAEGAAQIGVTFRDNADGSSKLVPSLGGPYRDGFRVLWSDLNGAASWLSNPWVWVVSFKRVEHCGRLAQKVASLTRSPSPRLTPSNMVRRGH